MNRSPKLDRRQFIAGLGAAAVLPAGLQEPRARKRNWPHRRCLRFRRLQHIPQREARLDAHHARQPRQLILVHAPIVVDVRHSFALFY